MRREYKDCANGEQLRMCLVTGVWKEGKLVQEEGRWRPLVVRGRNAGPGLLTLPPLKEWLPDVPERPTRGTAERGRSRGRDGGARPM